MLEYLKPLIPLDMSKLKYLVLHHIEAEFATAEDIHMWHRQNGWNGAGYNIYIRKDGSVIVMRGNNIGAHCQGFNSVAYGIAVEGNYDVEKEMPKLQFNALVKYIKTNFPKLEIKLHKELGNTACPGRYFPIENIKIALNMPLLKKGSKNDSVIYLQNMLNKNGAELKCDGDFGNNTDHAVREYQSKNGLTVDGIVGYNTWVKLIKG